MYDPKVQEGQYSGAEGINLIADPIHRYIQFTTPRGGETGPTEKDIIDSAWLQRLRYIGQLQMARWVFPAAEHSRFLHSLGTMHLASRFINHLYPSLKASVKGGGEDCPELPVVEETVRLAALLHDVGHGPFCHFFDHCVLEKLDTNHEKVGGRIITDKLADSIQEIQRGPSGSFDGVRLVPNHIVYLLDNNPDVKLKSSMPLWVRLLKHLTTGLFSVDNLDYVLRDSYFTGVALAPADPDRLIFYSKYADDKLCIHENALGALNVFLATKSFLYRYVYFHRTVRALEIHLSDALEPLLDDIVKQYGWKLNPEEDLEPYLYLTDSFVLEHARQKLICHTDDPRLILNVRAILDRNPKWKKAYEKDSDIHDIPLGHAPLDRKSFQERLEKRLGLSKDDIRGDICPYDPRSGADGINVSSLAVYSDIDLSPDVGRLENLLDKFPLKTFIYRVFVYEGGGPVNSEVFTDIVDEILNQGRAASERTAI